MNDNPLNCPLCGSEVEEHFLCCNDVFLHQFVCKDCGLESKVKTAETLSEAREKSIAAWNQRKPMEKIVEELKNLKKCYNGEEDAVMKSMGFDEYIQEIINLAEEGGLND